MCLEAPPPSLLWGLGKKLQLIFSDEGKMSQRSQASEVSGW